MFQNDAIGATVKAPQRASTNADQGQAPSRVERALKRSIDIVGAVVLLMVLAPLYLAVAGAVLLSMGGPIHYWQLRLGKGGRSFHFYKFRSMVQDAETVLEAHLSRNDMARTQWDTFQKLQDDPRITTVGRFIRRFSLDELPQLWNVLKGDMSLVGPRPCMVRQATLYGKHWEHYCAVRPGITGLWQVSGRNRLSYAQRVELDAEYVRNWSLWLDLRILARTIVAVLASDGAH